MALRRKLIRVGALILASSVMFAACSSKTDRRDRDDDEEEVTETSERVIETSEEPSETRPPETAVTETSEAPVVVDEAAMTAAYAAILEEYEPYLRLVQDALYSGVPPCAYYDITGDGLPELIIQYASDAERGYSGEPGYFMCADMRFFTYDFGAGEVVEMLHVQNTALNAGGGFNADAVVLDNGNVIVTTGWGDEDSEYFIDEYEVQGNELVQVNELYHGEFLRGEGDDWYYEEEYEFNDASISEADYNGYVDSYVSSFSEVLTYDPFYYSDWYQSTSWSDAVISSDSAMFTYDELYSMLVN